jgi:hypothetical protein
MGEAHGSAIGGGWEVVGDLFVAAFWSLGSGLSVVRATTAAEEPGLHA